MSGPKAFAFRGDRNWREQPHFVLGLNLRLTTASEGGRKSPIGPFSAGGIQYRPDWGIPGLDHPHELRGAPVLYFQKDLARPGESQRAVIYTLASPADWETVLIGADLHMYEGPNLCGIGQAIWKEQVSTILTDEQKIRFEQWAKAGTDVV